MEKELGTNLFWDFSIEVYQVPHVEDGLILMQDRHGLDVNLILLCCWLGGSGVRLKEKSMLTLLEKTTDWRQNIVEPLRQLRRVMKRDFPVLEGRSTENVRQQIKKAELDAEKFQQDLLYEMLQSLPGLDAREADRSGLMRANLLTLLSVTQCEADRTVIRPLLERLISASSHAMGLADLDES